MKNEDNRLTRIYKGLLPSLTDNKFELIGEFNEDYIKVKCKDCNRTNIVPTDLFLKTPTCINKKCPSRIKKG